MDSTRPPIQFAHGTPHLLKTNAAQEKLKPALFFVDGSGMKRKKFMLRQAERAKTTK